MGVLLQAMWDGFRLVCPACRQGGMLRSRGRIHSGCPKCGAPFDRIHEADWLITWINAYAATTVVLIGVFLLLYRFTDIGTVGQIALSGIVAVIFLALFYARLKGLSVGILHVMRTRWIE